MEEVRNSGPNHAADYRDWTLSRGYETIRSPFIKLSLGQDQRLRLGCLWN